MPISWSSFKSVQQEYTRDVEPHLHVHSAFTYYFWSSFAHQIYFDFISLIYPETGEVNRLKSKSNYQDISTENIRKLGLPHRKLFSGKIIGEMWDIFFSTGKMGEFRKRLSQVSQLFFVAIFLIFLVARVIEKVWMLFWDAVGFFFAKDQIVHEVQALPDNAFSCNGVEMSRRSDGLLLDDKRKPFLTNENYLVKAIYDSKRNEWTFKKCKSDISERYFCTVTESMSATRYIKAAFSVLLLLCIYFPLYGLCKLLDFTDQYAMTRAALVFAIAATVSFMLLPMMLGIIVSATLGTLALYSLYEWFWERDHFPRTVMGVSQLLPPGEKEIKLVINAELVMLRHEWVPQGMYAEYHQAVLYKSTTTGRSYLVEKMSDLPQYKGVEGYKISANILGILGNKRTITVLVGVPENISSTITHDLLIPEKKEEKTSIPYFPADIENLYQKKRDPLDESISLEDSKRKVLLDSSDYNHSRGQNLAGHTAYAEIDSAFLAAARILNAPKAFRSAPMGNEKHRIFVPIPGAQNEGRFASEILQGDYVIKREGMQLWIGKDSGQVNMMRDPDYFHNPVYSSPKDQTIRVDINKYTNGFTPVSPTVSKKE